MTNALVTIVAPLARDRVPAAEARIDALGNPPRDDIRQALDRLDGSDGTHFCSLHAVRSKDLIRAYLVFEFSADGTEQEATSRIARAIGPDLATVFSLASDWRDGADIDAYLTAHKIAVGVGLFDSPGLIFAGTPGMSVGRIRSEAKLALRAGEILAPQGEDLWALERVEAVRNALRDDPELSDMLETGVAEPPYAPPGVAGLIGKLGLSFAATYLWPVGIVLLLLALAGGAWNAWNVIGFWPALGAFVCGGLKWLIVSGVVALLLLAAVALAGYAKLRSQEERDSLQERTADAATLAAMFGRENHYAQNHMLSVTQRKPGIVRWFTARLVFWIIGQLATLQYRTGFLSDIGTIHFARWVTVPGTRDLLFLSNYDASWESYLEDFITRAHDGLTGVWSNSIGFPRSQNLFQQGATDGERFKRYARQSMIPTRFWYCAYPTLATTAIRTNTEIRLGLSGALTEDEATSWLALFGSAARPPGKLISSEIQSIVFGGLGRDMPFGTCLFYDMPETVANARGWLAALMPMVAFDDGRRLKQTAVATIGLGADGLTRLGLPDEGLQTFPFAFRTGLTNDARARILGDIGNNAAERWRWGKTAPHAAVMVYGESPEAVRNLEATLDRIADANGVRLTHRIDLREVKVNQREPFGFTDGISQPVIRGTYKGLKAADSIHLVEPGEFILGYPDNRGNTPPGPTLPAVDDPRNILPLVETTGDFSRSFVDGVRDLGRNGSFLVIRELEQDVVAFNQYCASEAERLRDRLPEPYEMTAEFIGAKLIGRWHNGSSIVRHEYLPKKDHPHAAGAPGTSHADPGGATERPTTGPESPGAAAAPVERPARPSHLHDNDFLFGTEDPEALHCPFGAHIRRANPRDSLDPGSQDQIDISNRHRIIRIGRQYVPPPDGKPGLLFMCLNGDLERQFEFVQQTWLKSPSFHGLSCEQDPLLGGAEQGVCGFTIPSRHGPVKLSPVPAMVATRGGGYFFLPGKRLLNFLAVAP
jgi:deferrochelatase/peroxidase EfeB